MCDICIPILGRQAKFHPGKPCVVAKTLYCSLCAVYGHSYKGCPETATKALRESTPTEPLQETVVNLTFPADVASHVEITDDEEGKCVRAMLIANNIVPMSCQEKGRNDKKDVKENIKRLDKFLKGRGKRLVLVKPYVPVKSMPNLDSE